jgi:hypothetical protein
MYTVSTPLASSFGQRFEHRHAMNPCARKIVLINFFASMLIRPMQRYRVLMAGSVAGSSDSTLGSLNSSVHEAYDPIFIFY